MLYNVKVYIASTFLHWCIIQKTNKKQQQRYSVQVIKFDTLMYYTDVLLYIVTELMDLSYRLYTKCL